MHWRKSNLQKTLFTYTLKIFPVSISEAWFIVSNPRKKNSKYKKPEKNYILHVVENQNFDKKILVWYGLCRKKGNVTALNKNELKIFIVDDNSFCLAMYEQFLLNRGYKDLHLFENGMDCLKHIHIIPDIVLVDHDMAGLNGVELLRKIKSIHDEIYVVMISGQKNPEIKVNAERNGVFEFIPKNEEDLQTLDDTLKRIIEEKKIVQ